MKALVYTHPNEVQLLDRPDPQLAEGDVLLRIDAAGICGSDMHAYHGHDSRRPAPLILGHEAAGRIAGGKRDGERVTITATTRAANRAWCWGTSLRPRCRPRRVRAGAPGSASRATR
jgi:threonine dehydrogenase-like Zn-dependent dehydrogenase